MMQPGWYPGPTIADSEAAIQAITSNQTPEDKNHHRMSQTTKTPTETK
jgi:hypothetical protein